MQTPNQVVRAVLVFCLSTQTPLHACESAGSQQPVDFDLSSSAATVTNECMTQPVTITAGEQSKQVLPGQALTPAEFIAVSQVISQQQTITLDSSGRAVGGSFFLNQLPVSLNNLTLPAGVTATSAAANPVNLIVGSAFVNAGTLTAQPFDGRTAFNISAESLSVLPGGRITTLANSGSLDLGIYLSGNLANAGEIVSSGLLSISAGGTVANIGADSLMSGSTVNILTGAGVMNNAGTVIAQQDMSIQTLGGLIVNNIAAGMFIAQNLNFLSLGQTSILGGQILSDTTNINSAGSIDFRIGSLLGILNLSGTTANVSVDAGPDQWNQLFVGTANTSAGLTLANSQGSVFLTQDLLLPGQNLSVVASQNIIALGATVIDVSHDTLPAGNLSLLAGFSSQPSGSGVLIDGAAYGGGNILMQGTGLRATSTAARGGDILVAAAAGSAAGETTGLVELGSISTSSSSDRGGNVTIFGQHGISIGTNGRPAIDTRGQIGGSTYLGYAEPVLSGPLRSVDGQTTGDLVPGGLSYTGFRHQITLQGDLLTGGTSGSGGQVEIEAGYGTISLHNIITRGGTGANASGGSITFRSLDVPGMTEIDVAGSLNASGGATTGLQAGNGGAILIEAASGIENGIRNFDGVRFRGDIISRGGDNLGNGNAGNGGSVTFVPLAIYPDNGLYVAGRIDTSGGDAFGAGNGGNGGAVTFSGAGWFTGENDRPYVVTSGGAGRLPGIGGTINYGSFRYLQVDAVIAMIAAEPSSGAGRSVLPLLDGSRIGSTTVAIDQVTGFLTPGSSLDNSDDSGRPESKPEQSLSIDQSAGNVVLFSAANQVFCGSADMVIVGEPDTIITAQDDEQLSLEQGRIFADTGKDRVVIRVGSNRVSMSRYSATLVEAGKKKLVVKAIAAPAESPIEVSTAEGIRRLAPGQELVIDESEELIAADGVVGQVSGRIEKETSKPRITQRTFQAAPSLTGELMIAGHAVRLAAPRQSGRVYKHISGNATHLRPVAYSHSSGRAQNLIANRAVDLKSLGASRLRLNHGNIIISPLTDSTIETELATIRINKDTPVAVEVSSHSVLVKSFGLPGSVVVSSGTQSIKVRTGEEVCIFDETLFAQHPLANGIARRATRVYSLADGVYCVKSDFSIVSWLSESPYAAPLRHCYLQSEKKMQDSIIKSAAILQHVTAKRGPYKRSPTQTAFVSR